MIDRNIRIILKGKMNYLLYLVRGDVGRKTNGAGRLVRASEDMITTIETITCSGMSSLGLGTAECHTVAITEV